MASTSGPVRRLVRNDTATLDPVGCCLALEGRLSSADSREGLSGALRQASQQVLSGGGSGGGGGDAPTCLSAQAHQLPAELLTAFQGGAQPGSGGGGGGEPQALDADSTLGSAFAAAAAAAAAAPAAGALAPVEEEDGERAGAPLGRAASGGRPISKSAGGVPSGPAPWQRDGGVCAPAHAAPKLGGSPSRVGSVSAGGAPPAAPRPQIATALERTSTAVLDANGGVDHGAGMHHDPTCTCPPYAVKSTCGKRPNMEDTYALCPNICELPMSPMAHEYADKLPHRIAVQFETHCMQHTPSGPQQQAGSDPAQQQPEPAGGAGQQQQQPRADQQQQDVPQLAAHQQLQLQEQQGEHEQQQQQQPPFVHHHHHHQQQQLPPLQQEQQPRAGGVEDGAAAFAGAASLLPLGAASPDAENSVSSISSSDGGGSVEKLHFFGVYDGHGGIEASQHCAQRLHYHLSKAVAEMASAWLEGAAGDEAAGSWNPEVKYVPVDTVRIGEGGSAEQGAGECSLAPAASAEDAAAAAEGSAPRSGVSGSPPSPTRASASRSTSSASSSEGRDLGRSTSTISSGNSAGAGAAAAECDDDSAEGSGEGSEGPVTSFCGMMEEVLRDAFLKTDEEFSNSGLQAGLVGSTAVVALVGTHRVWIANCGDSRAVLSRAGVAIQVTDDHKPEREDEAERVEKAGGQVLYWNGHRVMGVLAMSRAIGDHCLRPYVIPEPEISVFARHPCDEILLLASDGLWDVLTNQEATDLALRSIKRAREKGASRKAAARVAATVLTKAAVDRGSRDNITVVIIDLSPPPAGAERAQQAGGGGAHGAGAGDEAARAGGGGGCGSAPAGGAGAEAGARLAGCCEGAPPAAAVPYAPAAPCCSGGAGGRRPSSSGSSKAAAGRPGSGRATGAGGGAGSNPFAAAAASPFSTAATGSSELPLPTGASSGSDVLGATAAAVAAAVERSNRSSASSGCSSSRSRPSGTGSSASAFAAPGRLPAGLSSGSGASAGGVSGCGGHHVSRLAKELDSIDLSGVGAAGLGADQGSLPSIESVAAASSAAEGSTTSSSLEEQPTIVEPPPALARQPSSSPFSAFQGAEPFADGN